MSGPLNTPEAHWVRSEYPHPQFPQSMRGSQLLPDVIWLRYHGTVVTGWNTTEPASPKKEIPEATGIEAIISGMLGDAVKEAARRIGFRMERQIGEVEVERLLQRDIAKRQAVCREEYGQELAANDAPLLARLQHAYEEALDLPMYAEWAAQALPDTLTACELPDDAEKMAILELMDVLRNVIIPDVLRAAAYLRGVIQVIGESPLQLGNGEVVR